MKNSSMFDFMSKGHFYEHKINEALHDDIGNSLSTVFIDLYTNICNFDCSFCDGKQLYNLKNDSFSSKRLDKMASELCELGVDSVIFAGEGGESTLHPYFTKFAQSLLALGMKLGVYTNGTVLNEDMLHTLQEFDFVRISLNSANEDTHKIIHRYKTANTFSIVCNFIREISKVNKNKVGVSFVVVNENLFEIFEAVALTKKLGADYIEFKPAYGYEYKIDKDMYLSSIHLIREQIQNANALETDSFKVIMNNQLDLLFKGMITDPNEMTVLPFSRKCITSKLRMVISPSGCYLCTPNRSKEDFRIGYPQTQSLTDIWFSDKHQEVLKKECCLKCTYHEQNEFLLELKQNGSSFKSNHDVKLDQTSFL